MPLPPSLSFTFLFLFVFTLSVLFPLSVPILFIHFSLTLFLYPSHYLPPSAHFLLHFPTCTYLFPTSIFCHFLHPFLPFPCLLYLACYTLLPSHPIFIKSISVCLCPHLCSLYELVLSFLLCSHLPHCLCPLLTFPHPISSPKAPLYPMYISFSLFAYIIPFFFHIFISQSPCLPCICKNFFQPITWFSRGGSGRERSSRNIICCRRNRTEGGQEQTSRTCASLVQVRCFKSVLQRHGSQEGLLAKAKYVHRSCRRCW